MLEPLECGMPFGVLTRASFYPSVCKFAYSQGSPGLLSCTSPSCSVSAAHQFRDLKGNSISICCIPNHLQLWKMVASQCLHMTGTGKAFQNQLLPMGPPDALLVDHIENELDFSDVFCVASEMSSPPNANELVYDEPEVICSRSHSLVGPTPFASQSVKLGKLTLHETEYDLVEGVSTIALEELRESSFVVDDVKELFF